MQGADKMEGEGSSMQIKTEASEGLKVQRRGTDNNPCLVLYGLVPPRHRSRYLTGLTIVQK